MNVLILFLCLAEGFSEPDETGPLPPVEAMKRMTLPEGFQVELLASEPDIRQPIAFAWDERGRLWVAEYLSYPKWKPEGNDRVLVFEDTNSDGKFDSRKVFWDKGNYITGIQVGFGGLWVNSAPSTLFIPDKDGDAVADGEAQVVLDGWSHKGTHNLFNLMMWGPDGWLYGLCGWSSPSKVGAPGTPEEERTTVPGGVWRYHPVTRKCEVVSTGTCNPWGIDYDDYGQMFMCNTVVEHLWHVIPGSRFKNKNKTPYTYEFMQQCGDHIHWAGGPWSSSRGAKGDHGAAGGGHAHAGVMIYLGDTWPEKYRNTIFMHNLHGHRINHDILERKGSGYVGRHGKDFLFGNDQWFWGLGMHLGPDGAMYMTDWSDIGECHGRKPHRDSGRLYRVTWGRHRPLKADISGFSSDDLVALQLHKNDWFVRHARRLLQERAAAGQDMEGVRRKLRFLFESETSVPRKLRALWAIHVVGGISEIWSRELLKHYSEYIRCWAIQLECEDRRVSAEIHSQLIDMAKKDESQMVRLYLASALHRLPLEKKTPIARELIQHKEDESDKNLPLMYWYAVEPIVASSVGTGKELLKLAAIPKLRLLIARRLAEE